VRMPRSTRMNAPTAGSSTNMSTPLPTVSTITVDETVQHVSRRDLGAAGLQQRRLGIGHARIVAQDAEDRAHAAAHVEVRRAVERVEQHAVAVFAGLVRPG